MSGSAPSATIRTTTSYGSLWRQTPRKTQPVTWTKLSDDFSDDCWQLSDKAFRLHVEGLLWSNRKLTDLRLNKNELRRWAKHPEVVSELVEIGWWSERGDHYL